jgi:hypothetical protein
MTWEEVRRRLIEIHKEYCDKADGDHQCYCSIERLIIDSFDNVLAEFRNERSNKSETTTTKTKL